MSIYAQRCQRAQALMSQQGVDWLLITHSTDLKYFIGYTHRQSERLTLFLLPREGTARMVLPAFEIANLDRYATFFDLVGWQETEDPVQLIARIIAKSGLGNVIAIGDELRSIFLLRIQAAISDARYIPGSQVTAILRMVKDADEIATLSKAAATTDAALSALFTQPLTTMTERDVITFLHQQLLANGHEAVGTGIVAAGTHGAAPHHKTSDARLQSGQAVVVDFGGTYQSYRSDITRTFHLGQPSDEFRDVYEIVREAQQRAFEAVRPGVTAEQIDIVARSHISRAGYGAFFLHRTGHGIGLDGHEPPYLVQSDKTVLREGMTFSIEPGIYLADKFGVRIEDIVVVTSDGAERLNHFPRALHIVE